MFESCFGSLQTLPTLLPCPFFPLIRRIVNILQHLVCYDFEVIVNLVLCRLIYMMGINIINELGEVIL